MKERETEEKRVHSSDFIPYSYYKNIIPDYFPEVPSHWHREFEFTYIIRGSGEIRCGNEVLNVGKGDILIIQPDVLHSVKSDSSLKFEYDTLVFSPEFLAPNPAERSYIEFFRPIISGSRKIRNPVSSGTHRDEIKACAKTVFSCAGNDNGKSDLLIKSELQKIFWLTEDGGSIRENRAFPENDIRVKASIDYIQAHYCQKLTVKELARNVCLSESCFMSVFKKAVGTGAIDFLNRVRIHHVCHGILAGKSASEAAYECGFRNLSNFNRQFRRIIGCSPGDYRLSAKSSPAAHSSPENRYS